MEALHLTYKQGKRLLEMCKALYPEYKWGFGSFPTSEVGAEYNGLDYLDVTHINHQIPCIKSRFEITGKNTSKLKIVEKSNYSDYDRIEDGFVDNISGKQAFFTKNDKKIKQGDDYEETYIEGIHWFEFCIKQLIPKFQIDDIMELELTRILFCNLPNPIDYLYDKFKTYQNNGRK